eukprot:TRINITY_DN412_c0_g1_i1.p1 TRINITY_DN412_c0_g1~~TRINITY_DN412_c0_g1_i1.p1  ORF type:complete len:102 (+),score=34.67 TRINITY_DN412_c0_g1_i1:231-536(+)
MMDLRFEYDQEMSNLVKTRQKLSSLADSEDDSAWAKYMSIERKQKRRIRFLVATMNEMLEEKKERDAAHSTSMKLKEHRRSMSVDSGVSALKQTEKTVRSC